MITLVNDDQSPISSDVPDNGSTNDSTPTLKGTAEAGSTVSIYDGTTLLGTTVATGGNWNFTPSSALTTGTYTFTATATDAAGNVSDPSAAHSITIDDGAPLAPVITSGGGSISITTPTVTGTAEANTVIRLYDGITLLGTATADGSGNWSIASSALSEGSHTLTATATDTAGNASPAATTLVTIDTVAPAAPSAPDLVTASDTGASSTDNVTSVPILTLAGTAENGSTVTIYDTDGTTIVGSGLADAATGAYTITTSALGQGQHTLSAIASDEAGNTSSVSSSLVVVVDGIAPGAPVITSGGGSTSSTTPTVTGTAEANTVIRLYDGMTLLGTATADGSGNWSIVSSALGEASYSLTATATDMAGNTSPASGALVVTVDTTAPTVSVSPDQTQLVSGQTTQVTFQFSEAVTGFVLADVTFSGGTVANFTAMDADTYTVNYTAGSTGPFSIGVASATYTDAAGNVGNTASASFTVGSPAPAGMDSNDFDWVVTSGASTTNGSTTYGGAGADDLAGQAGGVDDHIYGGSGNDTIDGGQGGDNLFGGSGDDSISGAQGSDLIVGGYGADTLDGGQGFNTFQFWSVQDHGDRITIIRRQRRAFIRKAGSHLSN